MRSSWSRHLRALGSVVGSAGIVVAAGCASGGAGAAQTNAAAPAVVERVAPGTLDSQSPRFSENMTVLRSEPGDTIAAPAAAVWNALPGAYGTIGFREILADSSALAVATQLLRIHGQLGRQSLSRYLDCGRSAYGDNADVHEVTLRVRTSLEPVGPRATVMRTLVRAVETPQGSGSTTFRCGSTREMENRLALLVRVAVAGATPAARGDER